MVGILLVAHDNGAIRYGRMAELNAILCRKVAPEIEIAVVTNPETELDQDRFDHIIYARDPINLDRYYVDPEDHAGQKAGVFKNRSRIDLYELTPFKETLVLDLDYLVFNRNFLDGLTDSPFSVMLNREVRSVYGSHNVVTKKLGNGGIIQRWATVVYFRKDPVGAEFFRRVKYVEKNYEWFSSHYGFDPGLYRNDFTFSIAAHMMNGYTDDSTFVGPLPIPYLLFSWDFDRLLGYHENGLSIAAYVENHPPMPLRTNFQNVHFMNKLTLDRNLDRMIDYYG